MIFRRGICVVWSILLMFVIQNRVISETSRYKTAHPLKSCNYNQSIEFGPDYIIHSVMNENFFKHNHDIYNIVLKGIQIICGNMFVIDAQLQWERNKRCLIS